MEKIRPVMAQLLLDSLLVLLLQRLVSRIMPGPKSILFDRGFFPRGVSEDQVETRTVAKEYLRECYGK